jgi:alpha-tubulin suppressor-like RCC1 family protein
MIDVAVGAGHLATLTDEGRLFLTGSNVFGELGVGAPWYKRSSRTEPSPITALKDYNVLQVICGNRCTAALVEPRVEEEEEEEVEEEGEEPQEQQKPEKEEGKW